MILRFESPWYLGLLLLLPLVAAWPVLIRGWSRPAGLRYADIRRTVTARRSWRVALRPMLRYARIL
ncbi:MAG: hypothetical protein PVG54_14130, partial [Anaerolineae bacterium]